MESDLPSGAFGDVSTPTQKSLVCGYIFSYTRIILLYQLRILYSARSCLWLSGDECLPVCLNIPRFVGLNTNYCVSCKPSLDINNLLSRLALKNI